MEFICIFVSMQFRSHCPINYGLEHFGDKWSLLIIRDLMFKGKRHYNEFLEGKENVSTSVLRDKLQLLQEGGIITKAQDEVKKSRIRYSLTEKGIALLPALLELILWSYHFDDKTLATKAFVDIVEKDKKAFILEQMKALRENHLK